MIQGKIPNAFKTSRQAFLSNNEIASIITIIGCGYGKNFDISKCKFDKIIFLADADPDGSHIDTLLLRMFIMYMPELITAGKVYRAVPPLFGIKQGKTNRYFTTKLDFTKYVQNLFAKTYTLTDTNDRKLSSSEITNLFFTNIEYKDQMDFISNTFAVDPDMLESVLYYLSKFVEIGSPEAVASMASKIKVSEAAKKKAVAKKKTDTKSKTTKKTQTKKSTSSSTSSDDVDEISIEDIPITEGSVSASVAYYIKPTFNVNDLRKQLKAKYRFVDVVTNGSTIRVEGLVNSRYQYLFINDKFISACIPVITTIKNNINIFYKINGEKVSIYTLMCKFNNMIPSGLTRFKGLGEQDPKDLGISALRPDGDRALIRYTIESAKEEIETLRKIDSNMASLLRDVKITKVDLE